MDKESNSKKLSEVIRELIDAFSKDSGVHDGGITGKVFRPPNIFGFDIIENVCLQISLTQEDLSSKEALLKIVEKFYIDFIKKLRLVADNIEKNMNGKQNEKI